MESNGKILAADNDPAFLEAFRQMLDMRGFDVKTTSNPKEILSLLATGSFDLVTLDLDWGLDDKTGIDILRDITAARPQLPIIMITEYASIQTAVEATKLGAVNYIEKLSDREKIFLTLKNAVELGRLRQEKQEYLNELGRQYKIIGNSPAIKNIFDVIEKAAPIDSVILITGESGTGKELIARQIHLKSRRRDKKFVAVDTGVINNELAESELFGHVKGAFTNALRDRVGLFEEAHGGTIFLDEISNASPGLQTKLLHVIQEKEYRRIGENLMRKCDVRIVAATNKNLGQLVEQGGFREDLYYRLKVIEILAPPLRSRKEDILLLAQHFASMKTLKYFGVEKRFSPEALNLLLDYDWPGNVRELENTIEKLIIMSSGETITPDEVKSILGEIWLELPTSLKSLNEMTREFRKECIIKAINLSEGKISKAAEILQIDRTHLYKLISEYQLKES